jgi:hypothetical protein
LVRIIRKKNYGVDEERYFSRRGIIIVLDLHSTAPSSKLMQS